MYDLCQNSFVQTPLLKQLKQDDRLAQQLFQSAYVGSPQKALLAACDWFGKPEPKTYPKELLNPNLRYLFINFPS